MSIRRELDKRRQSKADVASVASHKQTMLGLLRATVSNRGDSPEVSQRRRVVAGDPEAIAHHKDGTEIRTSQPYPQEGAGHVYDDKGNRLVK